MREKRDYTYAYGKPMRLMGVSNLPLAATGPNNAVTTMTYDKLGRKLTMNDPDMGFWSYGYDGSGNLARQTDAGNRRLCFYYDPANRPTSKRHDGTGTTPCPAMWGGTLLANYTYHTSGAGKGMPASTTGGSGAGAFADTFTYDFRGRVTSYARVINGVSFNLSTTYDAADRVETLTYGNSDGNEVVTYTYDGEFPETLHSQKKGGNLVADLTHNFRGQLTGIDRVGNGIEDTALTYHDQNENFQLRRLNHGATNDDIPDFHYEDYDALTQLREMNTLYSTGMAVSTFTYDGVGRMLTEQRSGDPSGVNYNYTYTYGAGGNIDKRKNETSGAVRNYVYDIDDTPNDGRHYHALESVTGDGLTATFINDPNGNMTARTVNGVTYTQAFDVENRLTSVTVNGQATAFYYDADGNRTLTVQPNGTMVYTPFPEVERTVPASGPATDRNHYYLAGQLIAVRVKTVGQTGAFYYFYTDRQGSVHALRQADGTWVNGNYARYDAYGGYRTTPAATVNPGISDRGYTGHRMNNTGNDLGLIYMNARYYMPEVGRFISADTIVPEPANPQTYNRYSYALNSPVNFTDPTGHCTSNYEAGSQDMVTCLSAWNSVANYLYGAAFGSGGSGNFPNETVSDWLANADIGTLENLMESYGIGYGYTYTSPQGYSVPALRDGEDLGSQESKAELCQYWKECYYPVTDYTTIFVSYYIGGKIIRDDFGNWYLNAHFSSMPSVGLMRGDINIPSSIYYKDIADLAVDQRELIVQSALQGWGGGANVSMGLGLGIGSNPSNDIFYEGGVSLPGFAGEFGYTWLIFDK